MSNITAYSTFTGPISTTDRRLAEKSSRQQITVAKSQQVLLNSLSVCFVNFYLKCMGFTTELEASEIWDPAQQILLDIADLPIKNLGKLECRPVHKDEDFVYIPPEVQSDRIAYIVVQISESLESAKLLGFIKEVSSDRFPLNKLQPLEDFLEYLGFLELKKTQLSQQKEINLTRWFDNIFSEDWQNIESIFWRTPTWQFRSAEENVNDSVERAKLINFGIKAKQASVGIILNISRDVNNLDEINIVVSLHPENEQEYLPSSLCAMILDEEGTVIMEARAKNENRKIELEFSASPGDRFSIKIVLGDISTIENFVI